MFRKDKEKLVGEIKDLVASSSSMVVLRQDGLSVAEVTQLRNQLRDEGVGMKVLKNNLARIVVQGTSFESTADLFKGQTAFAYSEDAVAPSRVVSDFVKTNDKVTILGGALNGSFLAPADVASLAMLPSLDVLRAKILGTILAPATQLARTVNEPASSLARVLHAKASQ